MKIMTWIAALLLRLLALPVIALLFLAAQFSEHAAASAIALVIGIDALKNPDSWSDDED